MAAVKPGKTGKPVKAKSEKNPATKSTEQQPAKSESSATRPRLQAINQDFSDLDEQIRQAAHIIGLPGDWASIQDESARLHIIQSLVRARAEWVLRWALDKLKDETDTGKAARRNVTAWNLLDWMIHVLPVSRSAPHLRDAGLPSILERTLLENFDAQLGAQSDSASDDVHMRNASESNDESQPVVKHSRKRKRGTTDTTASKRIALAGNRSDLFLAVQSCISSIATVAIAKDKSEDPTEVELMKMVLRTESSQAARILRFWFTAVQHILSSIPDTSGPTTDFDQYLDLSLVLEVWDVRTVDSKDEAGASAEDFSTECLIPTLILLDTLTQTRSADALLSSSLTLDRAIQALEKLLARHLLAPSRAAFLGGVGTDSTNPKPREATALAGSLKPLRAKLLQAAQIEDAGESLPTDFASLFNAIPHLLDLAVRASPTRTPKGRLVEKPWIEATFRSLVECVGCSLDAPPKDVTRHTAVGALEGTLRVLKSSNVGVDTETLKKLFWYHSGVKYPEQEERKIHWSLIASLINLDASVFVSEPKTEQAEDLAEFIFDQISIVEIKNNGFGNNELHPVAASKDTRKEAQYQTHSRAQRPLVLEQIIVPIMSAFVQNRNLLGFLRRWDHQLVKSYKHENRKALQGREDLIWEDRLINKGLAEHFERSLTQDQIATLIQEHTTRMTELSDAIGAQTEGNASIKKLSGYKKASSSVLIIPALLQAIHGDRTLESLKPQLHALLVTCSTWIQDDLYSVHFKLENLWFTLCQLLEKLWPIELQKSRELQEQYLHPLLEQASQDASISRKNLGDRQVDSPSRAAATLFLLNVCEHIRILPGSEDRIQTSLVKFVKALSSKRLEPKEHLKIIEIFCADFSTLLQYLSSEASQKAISMLLSRMPDFQEDERDLVGKALCESIIEGGSVALKNAFFDALLVAPLEESQSSLNPVVMKAFLSISPSALPREKREKILNSLADLITFQPQQASAIFGVMVHLMSVPNATANLSTKSGTLFDISTELQKIQAASSTLQLFGQLIDLTLGHILPNQSQAQNAAFLKGFGKKVTSIVKAPASCSAPQLAILRATIRAQKDAELLDIKRYVRMLQKCLGDDDTDAAPLDQVLNAFNELPISALKEAGCLEETTAWLNTWMKENSDLDAYISSIGPNPTEVSEHVARLQAMVVRFKLFPSTKWLVDLTLRLLQEPISDGVKRSALDAVEQVFTSLPVQERLDLIPSLTETSNPATQAHSYVILSHLITTLEDRVEDDAELKQKQFALLPTLCALLADSSDYAAFNALLNSITTLLNDKPSLASQHGIESIVAALVKLTSPHSPSLPASHGPAIYTRICETARLILLVHRGRLGGRFHLLLPLLQNLLACLFTPNSRRSGALPLWLRSTTSSAAPPRLTPANAAQYTHLLTTLCNPPHSSLTKAHHYTSRTSSALNDPLKAARDRAAHFLYPLLAAYCKFTLAGRLERAVREKLMPGLWEVLGTANLRREGLGAMFKGLGRGERDVWRGVWGEWEGVVGRRVGGGGGEEG